MNIVKKFMSISALCAMVLGFCTLANASALELTSPNGELTLTVNVQPDKVVYSVSLNGQPLLHKASATVTARTLASQTLIFDKLSLINSRTSTVNRVLTPAVKQKSAHINESYNQLTIELAKGLSITYRLFDQGLGYRFHITHPDAYVIEDERVDLAFAAENQVYFPEEKSFVSHNERLYLPKKLAQIPAAEFASLPLLVDIQGKQNDSIKIVVTESGLKDYPGLWLAGNNNQTLSAKFGHYVLKSRLKPTSDRNEIIEQRADYIAKYPANVNERTLPWRILAIAKTDAQLLTNQLSYLLADESPLTDTQWIKPGKVAWDWWNANNIYGVDFTAGINTKTYKYYIDFAAKYGLDYILLDEGWYELGDVLKVVPDIDVEEIITYGKSKNVDVILWVIWETLDQKLEKALDQYKAWGAAGIKVDFMQRDDQAMVNYYWKVAAAAAKRQLLVNFHGSYKPAGLRRTYPNVITREGLRGLEHNKWGDYLTSEHNLTLPFIRMVAGPMDYTPGAMVNAQPENFAIVFNRPMSKTTRAHQVAMYVIYESPLQMLADSPSHYLDNDSTTQFIAKIPTVWDETQVIYAAMGEHIVMARRQGKDWFIGAMGNGKAKQFELDLSFLSAQDYNMTMFEDGINADKYASDHKISQMTVNAKSKFTITLAPNGGWAARLSPKTLGNK